MARTQRTQGKTKLIVVIFILVALVLAIGVYSVVKNSNKDTATTDTSQPTTNTPEPTVKTDDDEATAPDASLPAADPETLSSVAVEPLGITVFYTKGTPGFDFTINKTADGTEYVDFSSTELIGTKCTDDEGLFASIIKNPASSGDQTITSATVSVDGETYGLSLASAGCTSNRDLLEQYQSGFKNGFSSLTSLWFVQ